MPSTPRSWRAGPAPASWRGADRWPPTSAPPLAGETYWGQPIPGLRRPRGPAARRGPGARRPRRQPDGAGLHRRPLGRLALSPPCGGPGFANQPTSIDSRRRPRRCTGAYVAAAVRCAPPANKPTREERDRCLPYLGRELALLDDVRVIVASASSPIDGARRLLGLRPRPRFGHGVETAGRPAGAPSLCSYHPSQQNTFTGRLTEAMLDAVFARARAAGDGRLTRRPPVRSQAGAGALRLGGGTPPSARPPPCRASAGG